MSVLPFIASLLLFIVVGKIGLTKIASLRDEIAVASKDQATLSQKLDILTSLSDGLQSNSQVSTYALPEKNPALSVISQLRKLSSQSLVGLNNLKTSPGLKQSSGLSTVDVTFDLFGPKEGIFTFLNGLGNVAPLMVVDRVVINEYAGQATATVTIKSFWAEYPTKLPSLTQPINSLSADEVKTLTFVSALLRPQFTQLPAAASGGRGDPFNE